MVAPQKSGGRCVPIPVVGVLANASLLGLIALDQFSGNRSDGLAGIEYQTRLQAAEGRDLDIRTSMLNRFQKFKTPAMAIDEF